MITHTDGWLQVPSTQSHTRIPRARERGYGLGYSSIAQLSVSASTHGFWPGLQMGSWVLSPIPPGCLSIPRKGHTVISLISCCHRPNQRSRHRPHRLSDANKLLEQKDGNSSALVSNNPSLGKIKPIPSPFWPTMAINILRKHFVLSPLSGLGAKVG